MRVALFAETYIPDVNGVVAHVKTLKDGLEKLGHEVLVVTADKHCKHHYIQDGVLHCPSVEVKRFYGFGMAAPYSRKRLKMIADFRPDILHIHQEFGIGLSGIMAAKVQKRPLVYTLHTMYDQYVYYIAPKPFLGAATRFSHQYERFIARNATALTGPSQKCDEYFRRIGVEKKVNLIPNSADLDAFDPAKVAEEDRAALRKKLGIADDATVACFVGRLGKEKSVDVLFDYWAETIRPEDKLHLLIIGDGAEKQELEQYAEKLGIGSMVTFTGLVKHEDMPTHYAICHIFATASLSEMNSISMLESMSMGLPVLQRYDELNADQIKAGVNGFLFNTPAEMAEHLRALAALDAGEMAQRKEQVRTSVVNRGSADLAEYMITVYEKAIEEKAQQTPAARARHAK